MSTNIFKPREYSTTRVEILSAMSCPKMDLKPLQLQFFLQKETLLIYMYLDSSNPSYGQNNIKLEAKQLIH
jgi:hypothetical protein